MPNASQVNLARVLAYIVEGLLGVRECVLLCMPLRSGELCASASFTRKKCALNLLACGVLPRVFSALFTSPRVRWASSLLIFTHCHMG